jgi:phosphatidylserine/phosphatidylglycerophosphate/cardiolipin synthase-like enzyme
MQLKLTVIDREVVILESHNWTEPAERRNKEILEIKRSREYAEWLIREIEASSDLVAFEESTGSFPCVVFPLSVCAPGKVRDSEAQVLREPW